MHFLFSLVFIDNSNHEGQESFGENVLEFWDEITTGNYDFVNMRKMLALL